MYSPFTRIRSLMRRRWGDVYRPGAVSGRLQDRGESCGGGAFSVCPGDQDVREAALRIAERVGEHAHVVEIEFAVACQARVRAREDAGRRARTASRQSRSGGVLASGKSAQPETRRGGCHTID